MVQTTKQSKRSSKTSRSKDNKPNPKFDTKTAFADRKDREASEVWLDVEPLHLLADPAKWSKLQVRQFANIMTTCRSVQLMDGKSHGNLLDIMTAFGNYARARLVCMSYM